MGSRINDIADSQILSLVKQEGSLEEGFRLLMEKYQETLYWHIRRMVVEHEDANDVVQNTFIKVYKSIDGFKGKSKLYTWLYRIATNESITFLNKRKRHSSQSLEDEGMNLSNRLQADEYFDGSDIERRLLIAVEGLPPKQRVVFNLRYFDEIRYEEMSEILQTSVGALKASYHHAVKKIEHYFREVEKK